MKNQFTNGTVNILFIQKSMFIYFYHGGYVEKVWNVISRGGIIGVISICFLKVISENWNEWKVLILPYVTG